MRTKGVGFHRDRAGRSGKEGSDDIKEGSDLGKVGENAGLHQGGFDTPAKAPVVEVNSADNLLQSKSASEEVSDFPQSVNLKSVGGFVQAYPKASSNCVKVQDVLIVPNVAKFVPDKKSQFAKDPGKLTDTKGPILEGDVGFFASKGSLVEGGGSCSIVTVVESGKGSISLNLSGDLSLVH
ncbi:hypothetical protein ACOSP7_006869 [Xanthoceras sorbifolium]